MAELPITRRGLLGAAASSMGGAGLAATTIHPARAADVRTLTVATWGGLYEQTLRKLLPAFESAHNVSVRLDIGLGSTQLPKLIAGRGAAPFSVLYLNDDEAILGQTARLWAPDQSAQLANIADIYANSKPPALPMYGAIVYELPLVYNPAKLTEPMSWQDLWKPGLTVGIPDISNSYGVIFLYIAALLNGGSETNLDPGFAAIKKLANYKIYHGVTDGFTQFQQGEIDAALYYGHRAHQLQDKGIKVAIAHPKEGVWGLRAGVQIPRTAPEMDLARAFVDLVLSPDYQRTYADLLYSPSNRTVALAPDLAAKHVYGATAVEGLRFPKWEALIEARDSIIDRWNREIAS